MNYLKDRLQEKSTLTAFLGLIAVLLRHVDIPEDIVTAASSFLIILFTTSAVSKG
jgi:hypothetical protein